MALTGDGYKVIADKFEADAVYVKLIGVSFPEEGDDVFRGVFPNEADLNDAYPPDNETVGTFAFVKLSDEGDASYFQVGPINAFEKAWLKQSSQYRLHRVTTNGAGTEVEWNTFVGKVPTFTSTTVTSALETGEPLKLASPLVYSISSLPLNSLGIMVQGIVFERETEAGDPDSRVPFYYWGLGTNDWAGFTEPGEFVITSWDFKLGGFPKVAT